MSFPSCDDGHYGHKRWNWITWMKFHNMDFIANTTNINDMGKKTPHVDDIGWMQLIIQI